MIIKAIFRYLLYFCLFVALAAKAEIATDDLEISAFYYDYYNPAHVSMETPEAILSGGEFRPIASSGVSSQGIIWLKIAWDKSARQNHTYLINDSRSQKEEIYHLFRDGRVIDTVRLGHAAIASPRHFKPTVDISGADFVLVKSCCDPRVPLFFRVLNEPELLADYYLGITWHVTVSAIVIVMMLYNLFIFGYLRERQYLYYTFYLVSLLLIQWYASGLGKHFFWQQFEYTDILGLLFAIMVIISNILFQFSFLSPKYINALKRRIKKIIIFLCVLSFICFCLHPIFSILGKVVYYSLRYTFIISWIFILYVSISSWLAGDRSAKILLITQCFILFAGVISMMYTSGTFENHFVLEHIIDIAIVFEAVVLSLALAQKIQRLREENLQNQAQQLAAQQRFTQKLLTVQEKEKKRFSSVLHDTFTHKLLLLKHSIDDQLGRQTSESALVTEVLDDIRDLSRTLHPHMLADLGLRPALQDMITRVMQHQAIDIIMVIDEVSLNDDQQLLIYRIVQEALNNVIKHADASECLISLIRQPSAMHLTLSIIDDGQGFDVNTCKTGMGLKTLQERVDMLSGELSITSSIDGTAIHIQFPPHQNG